MRYERVVVPYDGSRRSLKALEPAGRLARSWDCSVEVVHVTHAGDPSLPKPDLDQPFRLLAGDDAATTLIDEVADGTGLLCMAAHGRSGLGEVLLGSVSGAVLRGLHAPLVVTGPQLLPSSATDRVRRLMVCLDGSTLAAAILPGVERWAAALDLEVLVAHVAYPVSDPTTRPSPYPYETQAVVAEVKGIAARLAHEGITADWSVIEDVDVAAGIVRHAARRSMDLIAMATHGRTGLDRVVVASTTADVLRRASVPVLTLRPEDLG